MVMHDFICLIKAEMDLLNQGLFLALILNILKGAGLSQIAKGVFKIFPSFFYVIDIVENENKYLLINK